MKLIKSRDNENYYERLVSDDGSIEMGVYPVMFGYRVRAGFVGRMSCEIDWCGGAEQKQVEALYAIAKNIIERKGNFINVPIASKMKPYYNDIDFIMRLGQLTKEPVIPVKLKPLKEYKYKMLNNYKQ
jgi:hypothetical protein